MVSPGDRALILDCHGPSLVQARNRNSKKRGFCFPSFRYPKCSHLPVRNRLPLISIGHPWPRQESGIAKSVVFAFLHFGTRNVRASLCEIGSLLIAIGHPWPRQETGRAKSVVFAFLHFGARNVRTSLCETSSFLIAIAIARELPTTVFRQCIRFLPGHPAGSGEPRSLSCSAGGHRTLPRT